MQTRKLGNNLEVSSLGLGCMGMSEFYGARDDAESLRVLDRAIEIGITFLDTADMYGPFHNEELLGRFLASRRPQVTLATKFGIVRKPGEYARSVDNSPAYARAAVEASLTRLGVERIDLYYVHRVDQTRPIEEVMGALSDLVTEGKIGHIGLSEVSADTLRRAHAVHPVTAVQTEYSLWDPRRGGRDSAHLPRTRHRLRALFAAGPRVSHRHLCQGPELRDGRFPRHAAALPGREPRRQPRHRRCGEGACGGEGRDACTRWHSPGCWHRAMTSSPFRARSA